MATLVLLLLVLPGPAEIVSGKYVRHSEEFLRIFPLPPAPLPEPLPAEVDALCRLIASGHDGAELFAALGEALLARGDRALAYRAFDRAHRLESREAAWGRRMQARKYACGVTVPAETIAEEESEARIWVDALQSYERARIARGEDPRDLGAFHARYGRPEDDLRRIVRAWRASWAGGVFGVALGLAFVVACRRIPRRACAAAFLVAALCAAGPFAFGRTGLFPWGGGFALAGGLAVLALGRPRRSIG